MGLISVSPSPKGRAIEADANTVALWTLDQTLADASPNGYDLSGSPNYAPGALAGKLGLFGGVVGTIDPGPGALQITGDVTVEAFVTNMGPRAPGGTFLAACVGSGGETGTDGHMLWSLVIPDLQAGAIADSLVAQWQDSNGNVVQVDSGIKIPTGFTGHLAFTRVGGGGAVKFYVNGVEIDVGSQDAAAGGAGADVGVGGAPDGTGAVSGVLNMVRVSSSVRTASEMQASARALAPTLAA